MSNIDKYYLRQCNKENEPVSEDGGIACPYCGHLHDDCYWEKIDMDCGEEEQETFCDNCSNDFTVNVQLTHTFNSSRKETQTK